MGRRPRGPRMAWFSGYRISYETWCQWVETFPKHEPLPGAPQLDPRYIDTVSRGESHYLHRYIYWKEGFPRKYRRKMPRPRYEKLEINTTPITVFLPVRWVAYSSEDQVIPGKPGYDAQICQEIESDRVQFQHFMNFVKEQGAPLSEDKVEFGWQKELDPHDDWRPW